MGCRFTMQLTFFFSSRARRRENSQKFSVKSLNCNQNSYEDTQIKHTTSLMLLFKGKEFTD